MGQLAEQKGGCPRCHGFMVPMVPDGSEEILLDRCEFSGWRCVNCGERIDRRIAAIRKARLHRMTVGGGLRLP